MAYKLRKAIIYWYLGETTKFPLLIHCIFTILPWIQLGLIIQYVFPVYRSEQEVLEHQFLQSMAIDPVPCENIFSPLPVHSLTQAAASVIELRRKLWINRVEIRR